MRRIIHYVAVVLVMLGGMSPAWAHDDFGDAPHDNEIGLFGTIDPGDKGNSENTVDLDQFFHCSTLFHLGIFASVTPQVKAPDVIGRYLTINYRLNDSLKIGPPTPPPNA